MKAYFLAVMAFLALKLAGLGWNLARFPVLKPVAPGADASAFAADVSVLIPVRDEIDTIDHTVPALLTQLFTELIFLDDGSTDGSLERLRALTASDPRVSVVRGDPAPAGWVGKTWACHQLAERARGSFLFFCDADIVLNDGAVASVLMELSAQQADVFSVFPRQVTETLGEQLLTPLIDDVLLCLLPFDLLRVDVPAAATANGSVLVFSRPAYDKVEGFAAVRSEIVEDVAMARRVRRCGLRLGLALGGELVETRMYIGYADTVRGFGRGVRAMAGGSRPLLVAGVIAHGLVYTAPLFLACRRRAWLLPLVLGVLERLLVELKTQRRHRWTALLTPLSPIAAVPVVVQAMRRSQTWKGRVYR
ncbi:MAG: glycosyl transferase family 2 [Pseudonocardiales bacterium]|nr:glycosyl transferase family 2 [Pseudonocardiales bacterium]